MADRSQHPLQIMENQTRFDLNAAVENWQQELAAQPELTPDVRRELETHVRDTVTDLQRRGLNDEESFWLARRRAGQPKQLGEEFAKADPAKVWRERLFWVVVILFVLNLWGTITSGLVFAFHTNSGPIPKIWVEAILPAWIVFYMPRWLMEIPTYTIVQSFVWLTGILPIVCFAFLLRKDRFNRIALGARFLFPSRLPFIAWAFALFIAVELFRLFMMTKAKGMLPGVGGWTGLVAMQFFLSTIWPLSHIAFMAWLMPDKKLPSLKRA